MLYTPAAARAALSTVVRTGPVKTERETSHMLHIMLHNITYVNRGLRDTPGGSTVGMTVRRGMSAQTEEETRYIRGRKRSNRYMLTKSPNKFSVSAAHVRTYRMLEHIHTEGRLLRNPLSSPFTCHPYQNVLCPHRFRRTRFSGGVVRPWLRCRRPPCCW